MPNSPSTPTSITVRQIDHVTLIVADLEQTRHFYVDLLGMKLVARPDFDFPGMWFQAGSTQIHATQADENSGQAGWADRHVKQISRGHHLGFEVDDANAATRILKQQGLEPVSGPKHRPDGPVQVYFHDPDGHLIELFSV